MNASSAKGRQLLAAALRVPDHAIADDAGIATLEAWDSLAHVRIMAALEEAIGRQLASEEIVMISRLSDIVAALDRR